MIEKKNILYQFKNLHQGEKKINNFISIEDNKILEEVNNIFIHEVIKKLSILVNNDVKLITHKMTIGFDYESKNIIKPFMYYNILEISPCKNLFYVIFSPNFLFVIINILFGGKNQYSNYICNELEMTNIEHFVNQKLIQIITKVYSYAWKKFLLVYMKFINVKKDMDLIQKKLNLNKILINNYYIFKINNVEVYFYLFSPLSLLEMCNKKNYVLSDNTIHSHKKIIQKLSIENMYDVSLNIVAQLASFSISNSEFSHLSIGDVLEIQNPKKVIVCVDKTPVFSGNYNIFDGKSAILIKEFINRNIDYGAKNKENAE